MRLNDALHLISIRSYYSPGLRITRYCVYMPAIMYFKYDVVNKDHRRSSRGLDGYSICAAVVGVVEGGGDFWRYFTGV